MSAVACAQLVKDVLHTALDRLFRNRELGGNLFVGVPGSDQPQHIDFLGRQAFVAGVFDKLGRAIGRYRFAPRGNRANGMQEFLVQEILQQVSLGTGLDRPLRLNVSGICSEDNDPRFGEFTADRDNRVKAVHFRHL
jgi:hypothetical protein